MFSLPRPSKMELGRTSPLRHASKFSAAYSSSSPSKSIVSVPASLEQTIGMLLLFLGSCSADSGSWRRLLHEASDYVTIPGTGLLLMKLYILRQMLTFVNLEKMSRSRSGWRSLEGTSNTTGRQRRSVCLSLCHVMICCRVSVRLGELSSHTRSSRRLLRGHVFNQRWVLRSSLWQCLPIPCRDEIHWQVFVLHWTLCSNPGLDCGVFGGSQFEHWKLPRSRWWLPLCIVYNLVCSWSGFLIIWAWYGLVSDNRCTHVNAKSCLLLPSFFEVTDLGVCTMVLCNTKGNESSISNNISWRLFSTWVSTLQRYIYYDFLSFWNNFVFVLSFSTLSYLLKIAQISI